MRRSLYSSENPPRFQVYYKSHRAMIWKHSKFFENILLQVPGNGSQRCLDHVKQLLTHLRTRAKLNHTKLYDDWYNSNSWYAFQKSKVKSYILSGMSASSAPILYMTKVTSPFSLLRWLKNNGYPIMRLWWMFCYQVCGSPPLRTKIWNE